MDFHTRQLQDMCRLCGGKETLHLTDRKGYVKENFSKMIARAFNIDVSRDCDGVHPQCICNKCRAKLQKWNKLMNQRKKGPLNIVLFNFEPHISSNSNTTFF